MKNRYLITITTISGTRHYSVRQVIKYVLFGVVSLVLIAFVAGYFYIDFLEGKIVTIEQEKRKLVSDVERMQKRLEKLNIALVAKKKKLEELGEKINDLETKIGLKGETYFQTVDIKSLGTEEINKILQLVPSGSPVENFRLSAGFGWRKHPILKKREFHPGIDIPGRGEVGIYATADGIVTDAVYNRYGYGNIIKIAHFDGFSTIYAHLKKRLVKRGDFVKKGTLIGYMGNTGLSTGQHLHYEVRFNKKPLNPMKFVRWSGENFYKIFKKERRVPWESLVKAIKAALSQKRPPSSPKAQK